MAGSTSRSATKRHSTNSRRGTANSKFLLARSRAQRPPGPYRPKRKPRPAKDLTVRTYWIIIFVVGLLFSLGQIWKADRVARLCASLDTLREENRDLEEKFISLQLKFNSISSYANIEPLARQKLGMVPALKAPVVITPVDDRLLAYKRREVNRHQE